MPLLRLALVAALLSTALLQTGCLHESANGAADAITPAAKVELFNGKDTVGWVAFPEAAAKDTWSVKDGLLACTGKPNGFLRTEKAYKQYRFTVEWRFTKPGKHRRGRAHDPARRRLAQEHRVPGHAQEPG